MSRQKKQASEEVRSEEVSAPVKSNEPLPYVGSVAGYSCPFCGGQNLEYKARPVEGAAAVHFRCRECRKSFATPPRELKPFREGKANVPKSR
jgi:hypothetical protein